MIISKKYKYVFVGIPFSGSSTISKELIKYYDGKKIYNKHSNIQTFLRDKRYNSDEYFIFGVYRDPFSLLTVSYNKIIFNANNIYTDKKFLIENGGHISKYAVNLYNKVIKNKSSFSEYLKMRSYSLIPYDFVFSINEKYLNYIMDFNNLSLEFDRVLSLIGLEKKRDLPVYNKTKKKVDVKFKKEYENYYIAYLNRNLPYYKLPFTILIKRLVYDFVHFFRKIKWLNNDKLSPSIHDKDY